jgi:hypothetical protein
MKIKPTPPPPDFCRDCPHLEKNPGYKGYTCLCYKRAVSRATRICVEIKKAERLCIIGRALGHIMGIKVV